MAACSRRANDTAEALMTLAHESTFYGPQL